MNIISVIIILTLSYCSGNNTPEQSDLEIFRKGAPQAFFFRISESFANGNMKHDYSRWEETFLPLNGILGKVLDEERPGNSEFGVPFFTEYKHRNPGKLVLVHFDPLARLPLYEGERFFAGHWLYYNGTTLSEPIGASGDDVTIGVEDIRLFSLEYGNPPKTDDIGICRMGSEGSPDWSYSEQVDLLDIDHDNSTITISRGAFGTKPKAFKAGDYIAAHRCDAHGSHPMQWYYNLAEGSPLDSMGMSCADVLVEEFREKFGPGGILEGFDGIAFDIMHFNEFDNFWKNRNKIRGADVNADGVADWGEIDGLEVWGIGMIRFSKKLREALGPGKLITGDGWTRDHQRSFGILNGIESEGWPTLWDGKADGWSGGLNRLLFWMENGAEPQFSYINHKHNPRGGVEASNKRDVPPNIDRLVMAGAVMTGAAFTYSQRPENPGNHAAGIYDELIMGMDNKANWLGEHVGPAQHLAMNEPDLLKGKGMVWRDKLFEPINRSPTIFTTLENGEVLRIESEVPGSNMLWRLEGIGVPAYDAFLQLRLRCDPLDNYPEDVAKIMARYLIVRWEGENYSNPITPDELMTWMNEEWFVATFYFRNVGPGSGNIIFEAEGNTPLYVDQLTIRSSADAMVRQFENGVVLANPSTRPYTFDLGKIFPGLQYRRITGHQHHQPETNNGELVGDTLTINSRDALFLVRER